MVVSLWYYKSIKIITTRNFHRMHNELPFNIIFCLTKYFLETITKLEHIMYLIIFIEFLLMAVGAETFRKNMEVSL